MAVGKAVHAAALEGVNTDPLQFKLAVIAQHGFDARDDVFGLFLFFRIGLPTQLEVDAKHVVGLAVQQHRLPGMEWRVKPEPALGRKVRLHHHVGNQEAVHENLAVNLQVQQAADAAARAIGHDQPIGLQAVDAVGRFHLQGGSVAVRRHRHHLVLEAQVQVGQCFGPGDLVFLQVILLQVDHAGALVVVLRAQVEVVNLFLAEESASDIPAHAFVDTRVAHAQAVQHLQRALGITNPA